MKKLLSKLFLLFLLPVVVQAQQNHVPNGSFEYYTSCPGGLSQLANCIGWRSYGTGTSDYFNTCATNNFASVPANTFGYQYPAHGQAYAGGQSSAGSTYVEYIATTIAPLLVGEVYEVSLSISAPNNTSTGINNIGVLFYDNGPTSTISSSAKINTTPQISYVSYGPIIDTANWVRLIQLFIADSAYDNIVIGGFPVSNQQTATINSNGSYPCYYYFDSVVVRPIGKTDIFYTDTLHCAGDTIRVPYRVNIPSYFQNNNNFTIQLSNSSGSFVTPVDIGVKTSTSSDTITAVIPANTPQGAGYRIRMVASNGADTSEGSDNIRIGNLSSRIKVSNSPVCAGSNLTLFISPATNATYTWNGPNSYSSSSNSNSIANSTTVMSGDYYVTVAQYGCISTDTLSVTVKPLPAKPVANNNSPLCAGDSLHLSSTSSTGGVSYSWAGPGGFTSVAQDTSIANSSTTMSGDYIVTANLNGCNRKDTTTVLVKPLPAAVTLSNNSPLCAGDTLHLLSTASSTGASYNWTGPGSFSAATQNADRANSTAGMSGWYKMLVGLNGCSYADSTYATIHPIPAVPNISYSNPLCIGETLNLGTTTVSGAAYSWSGPGNFSSSSQSPTRSNMQFGDTGMYQLTTTVNGCTSDTGTASIKINPLPFVVIFANPSDSICQGDRVNFTALPNNHGGTPAYQWYVNAQAAGTGTVFSTTALNNQDVIRCDMTESTKCSAAYTDPSNDITMNVLPWLAPSVSIAATPNRPLKENEYVTFTATATNAGNNPLYQWKRNGQDVVGATGSVWSANTLNDNDSISVEIISNYKCPQPTNAVSNGIVVKVLTGLAGISEVSGLMLYPNPNNGKFVLKGEALTGEVFKLEIINAMGQMVYKDGITMYNGKLYKEIDMPVVPAGLYMLRLSGDGVTYTTRFSVR